MSKTIKTVLRVFESEEENILDDFAYRVSLEESRILDERIRLTIKPPPKYISSDLWYRIIKKLFVIERAWK